MSAKLIATKKQINGKFNQNTWDKSRSQLFDTKNLV